MEHLCFLFSAKKLGKNIIKEDWRWDVERARTCGKGLQVGMLGDGEEKVGTPSALAQRQIRCMKK